MRNGSYVNEYATEKQSVSVLESPKDLLEEWFALASPEALCCFPVQDTLLSQETEQNRTDCLFDINHTVSRQSHIHITQYICHVS